MPKQQSNGTSKQSSVPDAGSKRPAAAPKAKEGKDAGSHTKSETGKGAGGGAKQGRKH